jgi:uncharacterized protein (TIGR00730 family)
MDQKIILKSPPSLDRSKPLGSICVYCGSPEQADPAYIDLARRFGAAIAGRGLRLVYGGGRIGLMGAVARAAHEAGGDVLGIMPRFLARREVVWDEVEHRMVETMHERKIMMFDESDAFVALPGGIGTLEEVVEMLSWRRLDLHAKPIAFLSEDDFWEPMIHLLEHTVQARLTPAELVRDVVHAHGVDECLDAIASQVAKV